MTPPDLTLAGSFDPGLVALSVVIAVLGAYVTIDLAERVTAARGRIQLAWLIGGATAMAIGTWSTSPSSARSGSASSP